MKWLIRKTQGGMTLIEVMIVIIVIAVLSLYVLSVQRDRAYTNAINRTMLDIKNWQEAALNYYSKNDKWPTNLEMLWQPTDVNQQYLAQQAQCSPWIGSQSKNNACPKKSIYQGQSFTNYFTVSIEVPNDRIAKQLAAKLPQSEQSKNLFKSSVGLPGYYMGGITSAGIVNDNNKLYLPKCPEGYEGHYIEAPQYFTTGWKSASRAGSDPHGVNVELGYSNIFNPRSSTPFVYAFDHIHSPDSAAMKYAYFITFCLPSGKWKPLPGMNTAMGQCSNDWLDYNSPFGTRC